MIFNMLWAYLIRAALGIYFIIPHGEALLSGAKGAKLGFLSCFSGYASPDIVFIIYHGLFVLLGLLIILSPAPIFPLLVSLIVLAINFYLNVSTNIISVANILNIVLILINLGLILYYVVRNRIY